MFIKDWVPGAGAEEYVISAKIKAVKPKVKAMISPQEFFNLLSDETRLRCLLLLQKEKELCVCEFSHILESIQPKISRHLSLLRISGLVLDERRGQWVYYRLNEQIQTWMQQVLTATLESHKDTQPYQSDFEKSACVRNKNICTTYC